MNKNLVITTTIIFFLSINVFAQKSDEYSVHVNLEDLPEGGRYELYSPENESIDKMPAESKGTSAKFTGSLEKTTPLFLFVVGNKSVLKVIRLFIGNEKVIITGTINDFNITGSETQNVHEKWRKKTAHATIKRKEAMSELFRMSQLSEIDSAYYKLQSKKNRKYTQIENQLTKAFIHDHPNSETSVFLLSDIKTDFPRDTIRALYSKIPKRYKVNKYGKDIELFTTIKPVKAGDKIVDFEAFDLSGVEKRFATLPAIKNKYVLLIFSGPGCRPCERAVPELKRIYDKNHDWLELVTYNQSISKEKLNSKAEASDIRWTYLGSEDSDKTTMYSYGAYGVPKFILLSPDQDVVYSFEIGYKQGSLASKIEEYE